MDIEISVVTSCYNAARWLKDSIESVLAQVYSGFEFIIVNDGSTDNTLDIIKRYGEKDKRIKIIDKPNTGLADSLNVGISEARGDWIARIDADDICMPDRLEKQRDFMAKKPEIVLLGSWCLEINEEHFEKEHRYPQDNNRLANNLEQGKKFFPHSSAFFRKDVVANVGGYRYLFKRSQDRDLWLRLVESSEIACLPDILVKIRKHSHSISYSGTNIYGMAARVCYFLRKNGGKDPSMGDEGEWGRFMTWLNSMLIQKHIFEKDELWRDLRKGWYSSGNRSFIRKGSNFFRKLVLSGHAMGVLKGKVWGKNQASRLAEEWAKIQ